LLTEGITNVENRKKNKTHPGFQDKTKEIKGSFRRAQVGKMLPEGWEPNRAQSVFVKMPMSSERVCFLFSLL